MLEAGGTISGNVDIDLLSNDSILIYSNNNQKSVLQKKITDLAIFDKLRNSTNRIESGMGQNIGSNNKTGNTIFIGAKEPGFLDYRGNNWTLLRPVLYKSR